MSDVGETPPAPRRLQWRMIIVLSLVWVLFWGDLTLANVLSGLVLGLLVTTVFPLPVIPFGGRLHPWAALRLVGRLAYDLVTSSVLVAAQAFHFGHTVRNGVVRVDLRSTSDLYLTLTTELMSLVPGSIVLEARRQERVLYLHVMDVRGPADLERAKRGVLDGEARVLHAFGSASEIAALHSEAQLRVREGKPPERNSAERHDRLAEAGRREREAVREELTDQERS